MMILGIWNELIRYGQRLAYQQEKQRAYEEAWRAVANIDIEALKKELEESNKAQARRFDGEGKFK